MLWSHRFTGPRSVFDPSLSCGHRLTGQSESTNSTPPSEAWLWSCAGILLSLCELGSAEVNSDALSLSHPQILRNQSDNFQSSDRNHHKSWCQRHTLRTLQHHLVPLFYYIIQCKTLFLLLLSSWRVSLMFGSSRCMITSGLPYHLNNLWIQHLIWCNQLPVKYFHQ